MRKRDLVLAIALLFACASYGGTRAAQQQNASLAGNATVDPALFAQLHWRLAGPFRGGRSNGVTGVPGQPTVFYFGAVGGGVWKTENSGRTWTPVFDSEPVASIGAIAVAPSNPNVIYAGTGEADMRSQISFGDGVYKSADAGKTWTHLGLDDTRQIGRILVDPRDPNTVFVAALGHAYGPNAARGVYRSRDGGATWSKVLYKGDSAGAIDLALDPADSRTVYAALWNTRRPPWAIYPPSYGPGSGIFKSTDGGDTWRQLLNGLPTERVGRMGVAVAPSDPKRVYAIVDAKQGGLYRSDDAGESWRLMSNQTRIWERGWYFCNVVVDPKNEDRLYVSDTSVYRSDDGGKTWTAIKGAPGGDDYHQLWIDPSDPDRMILASDQGTVVSEDGARTWSSWYNQPTAQLYHVAPDFRFPYWLTGAQQDSGAMGVPSRSRHRDISMHDWTGICAGDESGYTAPDPLHPEILFGGNVVRCNVVTGETRNVSPELGGTERFRHAWTQPLVFSEADPHALYYANQFLYRTADGGNSWQRISPDLTRDDPGVPPNLDDAAANDALAGARRGVIYAIAPSPIPAHASLVWAGTDDGYIQMTPDGGKTWRNVTPKQMTSWSRVVMVQASHFAPAEAFAAVDRHRLEDNAPYIYRTRDSGATWQRITTGLPAGVYVQCVREDPARKGLLFAGTELGVWVSFDDGGHWQSLQLNLPPASARDLAIHGDDLIVATHGRGFWVLDDISALRQITAQTAAADAVLFRPADAIRMPPGNDNGTPMPRDEALAENPPSGAIIDYYLKADAGAPVALEILDARGQVVRRYSSADRPKPVDPNALDIPAFWIAPPKILSANSGAHRWIWDLHYAAVSGGGPFEDDSGFPRPGGATALPGAYTVRLTVNGRAHSQPLEVRLDPRSKTSLADLRKQFDTAAEIAQDQARLGEESRAVRALRDQIRDRRAKAAKDSANAALLKTLGALDQEAQAIAGAAPRVAPGEVAQPPQPGANFTFLTGEFRRIFAALNADDAAPTEGMLGALRQARHMLATAESNWTTLKTRDLPAANDQLARAGFQPIQAR